LISAYVHKVYYTAHKRGQYKLLAGENGSDNPFIITVYADPTKLGSSYPVEVAEVDLEASYGIAINSQGEIIVTEFDGHQISLIDVTKHNWVTWCPTRAN